MLKTYELENSKTAAIAERRLKTHIITFEAAMSLSKPVIRNKEACVDALLEALPDVTVHVLRLIAEFVPYRELSIDNSAVVAC